METTKTERERRIQMDGFCWMLAQVLAEALVGKALDLLCYRIRERKTPRTAGKHFKGSR